MKLSTINSKFKGIHIKSGRYYRVYYLGNNKHEWQALTKVSEGFVVLEKRIDELAGQAKGGDLPLAVTKYLKHHLPTLTATVRKEHERMFGIISKGFEQFNVMQVEPLDCMEFLNLFDGIAAKQHYKYRLSAFFSWCVVAKLCKINPLREVTVKGTPRHVTAWTDSLFLDVRDKLEPMLRCYHDLSYLLHQRTTDVRLLERRQIKGSIIEFMPSKTAGNTGTRVQVGITNGIRAVLDEAAKIGAQLGLVSHYVIHTTGGTAYTRSGIYSAYRRADVALHGKATGLNPKDLRPYAATKLSDGGHSIKAIQKRLAHATQSTTEIYIQQHSIPLSEITLEMPTR